MPFCGHREKGVVTEQQKWDYINLSDFKNSSCLTGFSYFWLWVLVLTGVAVYAADSFTAVSLLAFDRWPSEVEPEIPLHVSKWIFAACIIFSFILLGYEFLRAFRVIRRGSVAESYLDDVAVYIQSIRMGKNGRGWRRFLVFAELTKSKKGVDYIALFVYFQFKGALRILVAEGPRVVLNALTLWAVLKANLVPEGPNAAKEGTSSFDQFFLNVKKLAEKDQKQALILSAMLFTLVIWVITAVCLLIAGILYILFLWRYIPSADGRLSHYCRRKIETRLERIVDAKVRKALDKEEAKQRREERGDFRPVRQPTLPMLATTEEPKQEFFLSRQNTQGTLPSLSSDLSRAERPGTVRSTVSNRSYGSDVPLMDRAGGMGYASHGQSAPQNPYMQEYSQNNGFGPSPVSRTTTPASQRSQGELPDISDNGSFPYRQGPGFVPQRQGPAPHGKPGPYTGGPDRTLRGPPFALRPLNTRGPEPGRGSPYQVSPIDSNSSNGYPRRGLQSPDSVSSYGSNSALIPHRKPLSSAYPPFNPRMPNVTEQRRQPPLRNGSAPPRQLYPPPRAPMRSATDPVAQRQVQRQTHGYTDLVDDYLSSSPQEDSYLSDDRQMPSGPYNPG